MLKIEVTGNSRAVTSAKGSSFTVQEAYAHLPHLKYPQQIELMPPRGQQPYAQGMYTLDPSSYIVDEYKKLSLRLVLLPLASEPPSALRSAK